MRQRTAHFILVLCCVSLSTVHAQQREPRLSLAVAVTERVTCQEFPAFVEDRLRLQLAVTNHGTSTATVYFQNLRSVELAASRDGLLQGRAEHVFGTHPAVFDPAFRGVRYDIPPGATIERTEFEVLGTTKEGRPGGFVKVPGEYFILVREVIGLPVDPAHQEIRAVRLVSEPIALVLDVQPVLKSCH